jgi:hypothetical protein
MIISELASGMARLQPCRLESNETAEVDVVVHSRLMQDLVSGSAAATIQFLKGVGAALVFITVYAYWR